jgi:hypothetical protein
MMKNLNITMEVQDTSMNFLNLENKLLSEDIIKLMIWNVLLIPNILNAVARK